VIGVEAVLVPLAPVDPAPVGGVGVRGSVLDRPGRPVVLVDDVAGGSLLLAGVHAGRIAGTGRGLVR
jgi:hypothetical protein